MRAQHWPTWTAVVIAHVAVAVTMLWVGYRAVPEALGRDSVSITVADPESGEPRTGTARPLRVTETGHAGDGEVLALAWRVDAAGTDGINTLPASVEVAEAWVAANARLGHPVDAQRTWVATRDVDGLEVGDRIVAGEDRLWVHPGDGGAPRAAPASQFPAPPDAVVAYQLPVEDPPPLPTWGWKGDSIGLAATLVWVDWLSPGDLFAGARVAATGTIDAAAAVSPVGSVFPKAAAAAAAGAEVVFVPSDAELARQAIAGTGAETEVVEVAHLDDALRWLCANGADTTAVCALVGVPVADSDGWCGPSPAPPAGGDRPLGG